MDKITYDELIYKIQNWEKLNIICNKLTFKKLEQKDWQWYIDNNNKICFIKLWDNVNAEIKKSIKNIYIKN